jgi:hypothetical protein
MAFGQSQRRSGFGGNSGSRGAGAPQRQAATPPQQSGRGGGSDKPRSSWTTASTLYDPYHSCMEVQIVSEWYRTALCIKLAPVFAERRGADDGGTGKKYDHDNSAMVVLDLNEAIVFRAQLEAFINGQLAEILLPRLETKRLVMCAAEVYYDQSHPEFSVHANGLAMAIEEDPTDKSDGKNVVFISRQQAVVLEDGADPVAFFPELQALLAVIDSYIGNCARVDFGSVRLLEQRGQAEERPAGPAAPMPTRRSGGLGAPASRPAASAAAAATAESGGASTQPGDVSEAAIGAALDGATTAALDDVLGDVPRF